MKIITILLSNICLIAFVSCDLLNPDSNQNFSITTERNSYTVQDKFTAKVLFENNLNSSVSLQYSGCDMPNFILEKLVENEWITADAPLCIAIVIPPREIKSGRIFVASVKLLYLSETNKSGTYRFSFDIRQKAYGKSIDSAYLYSNSFTISRE
ncbi:MAG TPA: hypothetical protein VLH59_06080 [Ignavibacteriaceae bacterium]|nr:hypothetical protein [Ignavibacteriaceae bacterium]